MGLLEEKLVESKSGDGNNGMLHSEDEENDLNPRIQESKRVMEQRHPKPFAKVQKGTCHHLSLSEMIQIDCRIPTE